MGDIHTFYCGRHTHLLSLETYTPSIVEDIHTFYHRRHTHLLSLTYTPSIVGDIHTFYRWRHTHILSLETYTPSIVGDITPSIVGDIHTFLRWHTHLSLETYTPSIVGDIHTFLHWHTHLLMETYTPSIGGDIQPYVQWRYTHLLSLTSSAMIPSPWSSGSTGSARPVPASQPLSRHTQSRNETTHNWLTISFSISGFRLATFLNENNYMFLFNIILIIDWITFDYVNGWRQSYLLSTPAEWTVWPAGKTQFRNCCETQPLPMIAFFLSVSASFSTTLCRSFTIITFVFSASLITHNLRQIHLFKWTYN